MTFNNSLRFAFNCGFFGSVISIPFVYLFDVVSKNAGMLPGVLDLVMIVVAPFLAGFMAILFAMLAYPCIRLLVKRGLIRDFT